MQTGKFLAPLFLLALGHGGLAADLPGAGAQMQQIPAPPAPAAAAPPEVRIVPAAPGAGAPADQTRFMVRTLAIDGASLYPAAELMAETGFTPGGNCP